MQLLVALDHCPVSEAVETVAADVVLLAERLRQSIERDVILQIGIERRVKNGDGRCLLQLAAHGLNRLQGRLVVQGRQPAEGLDFALQSLVNQRRSAEASAAVNDTMPY